MEADGGLSPKLDALVKIEGFWAEAFKEHEGAMVPSVQMGGISGGTGVNATQQMMELLSVKAAKELGVEMQVSGANQTVSHSNKK
jgi:hypothetical protein